MSEDVVMRKQETESDDIARLIKTGKTWWPVIAAICSIISGAFVWGVMHSNRNNEIDSIQKRVVTIEEKQKEQAKQDSVRDILIDRCTKAIERFEKYIERSERKSGMRNEIPDAAAAATKEPRG